MTTNENVEELGPSDLGTLDFWENVYTEELDNFKDHGDVGEIWFGRSNSLKVVRWICSKPDLIKKNDRIIDIGCGNGMMLVELANKGFTNLMGVDYSQKAVNLTAAVLNDNNIGNVEVEICDILDSTKYELPTDFRVAHDKGTYDAVSLHPDNPGEKREIYIENVHKLLLPDGYLVLTSCNWTKNELNEHFKNHFQLMDQLPTDTFQFGGQTGNTITQLVFKKK